jgi:hypothetical protein
MASGIATIHVRRSQGKLKVIGMGQTPRGQAYIKRTEVLEVKTPADPKYKGEMAAAVEKLFAESPATG